MVLSKAAVTGASGMVGRHVLAALEDAGVNISASSRTQPVGLPESASWAAWDLNDWKSCEEFDRIFGDVQIVIHAGAQVPHADDDTVHRQLFDANVRACLSLGRWALERNVPVVFISGSIVYADPERPGIKETDATSGAGFGGFYGCTKFLAEQVLENLRGQGLKVCILRPSSIYGHGLPQGKMIADFLTAASRGKDIEISPPADDGINLIHARDVAHAVLLAARKECWDVFNIAGVMPVTIKEIAKTCTEVVGRGKVRIADGGSTRDPIVRFDLNCDLVEQRLGFIPEIDLRRGLELTWKGMAGG